jgi:hypothetical protein
VGTVHDLISRPVPEGTLSISQPPSLFVASLRDPTYLEPPKRTAFQSSFAPQCQPRPYTLYTFTALEVITPPSRHSHQTSICTFFLDSLLFKRGYIRRTKALSPSLLLKIIYSAGKAIEFIDTSVTRWRELSSLQAKWHPRWTSDTSRTFYGWSTYCRNSHRP